MSANKILITPRGYHNQGEKYAELLKEKGYTPLINTTGKQYPRDEFLELAKEVVGIIVGVEEIDEELIKNSPNLKAVVKFGVGLDNFDLEATERFGIKVGRCVGSNSNAVAESALTLMLMCAKHFLPSAISVRNGEWVKSAGFELKGKKLGIIGYGSIGQRVATLARVFGMEIYAFDLFDIPASVLAETDAIQSTKEAIYKNCDVITLHLPLTDETRDMINIEELKMMNPSTILINTARGGIVNEKALYESLKNNEIYAAGFDVFTSEPPAKDQWIQELLQLDNFVLTSHIAARTNEAEVATVKIATETLIDLLEKK